MNNLHVTSFNACNFGEWRSLEKQTQFVTLIAITLSAPDIIGLQEIGGTANEFDMPVTANIMHTICEQLCDSHDLHYSYHDIAPYSDQNGGEKGLNIRCGFLIKKISNNLKNNILANNIQVKDMFLISPTSLCFAGDIENNFSPSRPPLALQITFNGLPIILINCHLKSMRAHPKNLSHTFKRQRHLQAQAISEFTSSKMDMPIIILGDMNDVPESKTLSLLRLNYFNSALTIPAHKNACTCQHGGRPMILDHMLFNHHLTLQDASIRMVHAPPQSKDRLSDHNPISAHFFISNKFK